MEPPDLTSEVAAAIDEAVELSDWIAQAHPHEIVQTRVSMVAGPLYGICLEHREAMLLLFRYGCRTSAYALFRSVYEALMRATWAELCLDEQGLQRLVETKAFPKLETMIKKIDQVKGDTVYATLKRQLYEAMSDYSHGGVLQLERWATLEKISAMHPDSEVLQILRLINLFGLLAVWGVVRLAKVPEEVVAQKAISYANYMVEKKGV